MVWEISYKDARKEIMKEGRKRKRKKEGHSSHDILAIALHGEWHYQVKIVFH